MGTLKFFSIFSSTNNTRNNNGLLPSSNTIRQNLIKDSNSNNKEDGSNNPVFRFLRRFMSGGIIFLISCCICYFSCFCFFILLCLRWVLYCFEMCSENRWRVENRRGREGLLLVIHVGAGGQRYRF